MQPEKIKFAFFGTPELGVIVLEELHKKGFTPSLIITSPDMPQGRKLVVTPPAVKVWAEAHHIPLLQPETFKDGTCEAHLKKETWDLFVVAAYGKLIPESILNIPRHKTLNVHPSLLPRLRGPAPIQGAILHDETENGVTIMRLDAQMDHGPIVAQEKIAVEKWPDSGSLHTLFAHKGGELLARTIPDWITGKIKEQEQNHAQATYIPMIKKGDALINFDDEPYLNFRKIQAYKEWPKPYFFVEKNGKKIRVIITSAEFKDGKLEIRKVIPEGKKEMDYQAFTKTLSS